MITHPEPSTADHALRVRLNLVFQMSKVFRDLIRRLVPVLLSVYDPVKSD